MLPECRSSEDCFSIPIFSLKKKDVNDFIDELKTFHGEFRDCFRKEPGENVFRYMVGQLGSLERKSAEPIALHVEGGTVRSMQRAISDAFRDEDKIMKKYHNMIRNDMGHPEGVIISDESGFRKKGKDSVGVARQYCGNPGKVENCQVGVFAAYASPHGYALADKRLFIPEQWFSEAYYAMRRKCRIPEEREFLTKPQLAAEMPESFYMNGSLPFRYIMTDCLYGNSPEFTEAADNCVGKTFFSAVSSDTRCRFRPPAVRTREYRYRGKLRSKDVVPDNKPVPISELKNISNYFRYKRKVSEGTEGPILYEFTKRKVTIAKNGLPWKTVWLIVKRTIGKNPTCSYYISNAPESTRLNTFVWLSGIRWAIEQCFEETKTELGTDQYEVRKYSGWNHHILSCMLAHFFLWHLKIRMGKKSSCDYALAA